MPFKPGQSGNPAGSPPKAKLFRDALMLELKRADNDVERIQQVARRLVEDAISGVTAAQQMIADRIDGKVPQAIGGTEDLPDIKQRIEFSWQTAADQSDQSKES